MPVKCFTFATPSSRAAGPIGLPDPDQPYPCYSRCSQPKERFESTILGHRGDWIYDPSPEARVKVGGTRNVEIADPSTHNRGFVLAGGRADTCPAARTEERLYRMDLYWRGAPRTDGQFQAGSKQGDRCSGTGARHFDVRVELSSGPEDLRCYRAVPKL